MVTIIEVTRQKVFVLQVLWLLVSVVTLSHAGSDRKIHFDKKKTFGTKSLIVKSRS